MNATVKSMSMQYAQSDEVSMIDTTASDLYDELLQCEHVSNFAITSFSYTICLRRVWPVIPPPSVTQSACATCPLWWQASVSLWSVWYFIRCATVTSTASSLCSCRTSSLSLQRLRQVLCIPLSQAWAWTNLWLQGRKALCVQNMRWKIYHKIESTPAWANAHFTIIPRVFGMWSQFS